MYAKKNDSDELMHYGVKGMKWGVRRYQNKDGTLTDLGKRLKRDALQRAKSGVAVQTQRHERNKQELTKARESFENVKSGKTDYQELELDYERFSNKGEHFINSKRLLKTEKLISEAIKNNYLEVGKDYVARMSKRGNLYSTFTKRGEKKLQELRSKAAELNAKDREVLEVKKYFSDPDGSKLREYNSALTTLKTDQNKYEARVKTLTKEYEKKYRERNKKTIDGIKDPVEREDYEQYLRQLAKEDARWEAYDELKGKGAHTGF